MGFSEQCCGYGLVLVEKVVLVDLCDGGSARETCRGLKRGSGGLEETMCHGR